MISWRAWASLFPERALLGDAHCLDASRTPVPAHFDRSKSEMGHSIHSVGVLRVYYALPRKQSPARVCCKFCSQSFSLRPDNSAWVRMCCTLRGCTRAQVDTLRYKRIGSGKENGLICCQEARVVNEHSNGTQLWSTNLSACCPRVTRPFKLADAPPRVLT